MHLLALSAFRPDLFVVADTYFAVSQCTFWCSVLSDVPVGGRVCGGLRGLNAPSGAQCFPTSSRMRVTPAIVNVSMHLLVLSAFRHRAVAGIAVWPCCLNAPSGAQCFPTNIVLDIWHRPASIPVSMHLLVLSAFRPGDRGGDGRSPACLNAPSGAQCFPT